MSWDNLIVGLLREAVDVSRLPEDFEPSPLGSRRDVIAAVAAAAPMAKFSDPSWGEIVTPGFVIEVSLGREKQSLRSCFTCAGTTARLGS